MKVAVILIIIGAFVTIPKGLVKGQEELKIGRWAETIQTTALLKSARMLRRVLESWGYLLSLWLQWKTISLCRWEKLAKNNNNNNRNRIWHRKMRHVSGKWWRTTHNGRSRTTKSSSHQNARRKGNLQILGNIGSWYHQTSGNERKNQKRVSQKSQKITRDKTL